MNLTIKQKLQYTFIVLFILLISSFLISYFAGKRQQDVDIRIVEQQFIINDIYQNLEKGRIQLERYLQRGGAGLLKEFDRTCEALQKNSFQLESFPREVAIQRHLIDLKYQVMSFIEEARAAISYSKDGILSLSNSHYQSAIRINRLIRENFLEVFKVVINDMEKMKENTLKNQRRALFINITILAAISLLYLLFMFEILKNITGPIRDLTRAAESVSRGDMDIDPIPIRSTDELKIMALAFNKMLEVIRSQLAELERKRDLEARLHQEALEIERMNGLIKETELKALQARINPHFLFNTLNTVKQTAYLESAERTSELVESFSSMLRYNLDCFDRNVRVEQEVQTLGDYLAIQKHRFRERIHFVMEMDDAAADALIPALSIQPFVENAIIHGLKETIDEGLIEVHIVREDERVITTIRDNGSGIDQGIAEIIKAIFLGQQKELLEQTGIGIRNVYQRLHISFGGEERLSLSTITGMGTEFRIDFPYHPFAPQQEGKG